MSEVSYSSRDILFHWQRRSRYQTATHTVNLEYHWGLWRSLVSRKCVHRYQHDPLLSYLDRTLHTRAREWLSRWHATLQTTEMPLSLLDPLMQLQLVFPEAMSKAHENAWQKLDSRSLLGATRLHESTVLGDRVWVKNARWIINLGVPICHDTNLRMWRRHHRERLTQLFRGSSIELQGNIASITRL